MQVFCVTAIDRQGNAVAAWVAADDPDACSAKAMARLGDGGRITHIVKLCDADLITFNRNKLDKLLSLQDRVEFSATTLLDLIEFQQKLTAELQATVAQLQETLSQLQQRNET